jgi:hypothetical protein
MGKGHTKLMHELKGNHKVKIKKKYEEEVAKAMDEFAQEVYEEVIEPHDRAKGR